MFNSLYYPGNYITVSSNSIPYVTEIVRNGQKLAVKIIIEILEGNFQMVNL